MARSIFWAAHSEPCRYRCRNNHIVEKAETACARITHQEIASMVGSVREVVQRALKELERDGVIKLERTRIEIRAPARLERWAHEESGT